LSTAVPANASVLGNRSYGHIVRAFLNPDNERVISYTQARDFCREYSVNESWMLDGIGTPFGLNLRTRIQNSYEHERGNILFTTTDAFAGTAVDNGSFATEDSDYFSLPGLSGSDLVAFPVNGNSMEPVIENGDVVVCREVEQLQDIRENEIYAVRHNGSVWIKHIQKLTDKNNRVTHLKLISANHFEHDPFIEEINEYTRLYKVIRKISGM